MARSAKPYFKGLKTKKALEKGLLGCGLGGKMRYRAPRSVGAEVSDFFAPAMDGRFKTHTPHLKSPARRNK